MTDVITTRTIVPVALKPISDDHVWRVYLPGTGKVIGRVVEEGRRKWRAGASEYAFIGDGPDDDAVHRRDWAPRRLYAPLLASEGHYYLPGVHGSREDALAALLRYLDEHQAPAMGHGPHPDVQHGKATR